MAEQFKTLEELYTREQIRKVGEVYRTNPRFDWAYCPIVFSFPSGFYLLGGWEGDELYIHVKAAYMLELWNKALQATKEKYPNFLKHIWIKEGYFKFIHYLDPLHKDALSFFWKQLETIADSRCIFIKESKTVGENNMLTLVCQSLSVLNSKRRNASRSYLCSDTKFTYPWDEVKEHFIELSDKEVSFLHGKEMNDYNPASQPLFDACKNLDIEGVKKAVESGIDVNSFDKDATTPICSVIPSYRDDLGMKEIMNQDSGYTARVIKIMDYLLEKGANINLYGFDGEDCLTNAHFTENLRLIEYLFQHGISKYSNCFITDLFDENQWYQMNAAYDYITTDITLGDYNTENLIEQEKILDKYGVEYFIDGWDNEKLEEYYDSLPDVYK